MTVEIKNQEQLRSAVAAIHSEIIAMSNEKDNAKVTERFLTCKDYLLEIFTYNNNRTLKNNDVINKWLDKIFGWTLSIFKTA